MSYPCKYGRGKKNFVNTEALRLYRDNNEMTTNELAAKLDDQPHQVAQWLRRSRVPRAVLEKLGITVRGPYKKQTAHKKTGSSIPSGGTIYACYVGAAQKDAFLAFCSAMHINAKDMI